MKKQERNTEYDGGFSKEVLGARVWIKYTNDGNLGVCGYIGSSNRNNGRDKIIESILRDAGLEANGIATWLTSTNGRHLMDNVDSTTSKKQFLNIVNDYTKSAFIDVTIWAHPDFNGTYKSTIRLRRKIHEKTVFDRG